eukprot:2347009-Pyramimonas_sp.AAC.1
MKSECTNPTVETHAKKHPACLQGALGFDGFLMESVTLPHQMSIDVLGSQGWRNKKRHKQKLSELRADFLDRRLALPGDASGAAPRVFCAREGGAIVDPRNPRGTPEVFRLIFLFVCSIYVGPIAAGVSGTPAGVPLAPAQPQCGTELKQSSNKAPTKLKQIASKAQQKAQGQLKQSSNDASTTLH